MFEIRDHVSVRIDTILLDLPPTHSISKPSIFRVDDDLRSGNETLYDPKILSIGPFHHGKHHLQNMEHHKFRYLKLLLKRRNESTVDKYIVAMRSLERKAHKSYAEPLDFTSDEFVQMLLLDGCFIIELIRKYAFDEIRERDDDPIFQYEQVLGQLRHDLILVENQVPFFVLDQLFDMTRTGNPDDNIHYLINLFIDADISPRPQDSGMNGNLSFKNVDHLLGFLHMTWCSSFSKIITTNRTLLVNIDEEKFMSINCATELQEVGVKFEKDKENRNSLDIRFVKGTMKIPGFTISDETESFLRNLIAYEHSFIDNLPTHVTDYAFFLGCLINTPKDVEILRREGIITNLVGDDEMVYRMFSGLGRNILTSSNFSYGDVFDEVNRHWGRRRNRWMANLRRNYFNSPWAYVAFCASLLLLLFTLIQTVFSVLSYTKSK